MTRLAIAAVFSALSNCAVANDLMSDTWVATDGLGRSLPTAAEAGPPRKREVALFYFLWHYPSREGCGPYDVSKALKSDPDLMEHPDSPLLGRIWEYHHWGEPLLGYYRSDDPEVLRKHARMLGNAGIDMVAFDVTNGEIYERSFFALLDAFAEVASCGGAVPKIAFLCPLSAGLAGKPGRANRTTVMQRLWRTLYSRNIHPELWYRLDGKPLMLGFSNYLDGESVLLHDAVGGGAEGRFAARLEKGRTLGYGFSVDRPIGAVKAMTPNWNSPVPCSVTLRLMKDGPGGEVVAETRVNGFADNERTGICFEREMPPGTYYLELSDPEGNVGWWSRKGDAPAGGQAYSDGIPCDGFRHLQVTSFVQESVEMRRFFTFRDPSSGGYLNKSTRNGGWSWLEAYPQVLHRNRAGEPEMMCVSVAQNCGTEGCQAMSKPGSMGRRYHGGANDPDPGQLALGPNFQEQWDRALAVDPPIIWVTGWNEWIMQRCPSFAGWKQPAGCFVDQFNEEFSRDCEPMRGGFGDAYYWQLVSNVRRFKGVRAIEPVKSRPVVVDGRFDDWRDVSPEFRDRRGDPTRRNHPGFGAAGPYVDDTGRNDIVSSKVSLCGGEVCFMVETAGPLKPGDPRNWMLLFVDADCDPGTGWLGYDFAIRPGAPPAGVKVACGEKAIELSVPASRFPGGEIPDKFDFKWADNCLSERDWQDFTLHGDAAPDDRYNYRAILDVKTGGEEN